MFSIRSAPLNKSNPLSAPGLQVESLSLSLASALSLSLALSLLGHDAEEIRSAGHKVGQIGDCKEGKNHCDTSCPMSVALVHEYIK